MVELVHGQKFSERAEPSQSEWGGLLFGSNVRLSGRDRKEYARPPQQRAMPADGGLRCFDAQFQSTVALVTLALPRAAMSQSNTASQMDRQPAQLPI